MTKQDRIAKRVLAGLAHATATTPRAELVRAFARLPRDEEWNVERRARRNAELWWSKRFDSSMSLSMMRMSRQQSPELEAADALWTALARELGAIYGKPVKKLKHHRRWKVPHIGILGCSLQGMTIGMTGPLYYTLGVGWRFGPFTQRRAR